MSPQALGQGPESPGTAGLPRSSSGTGRNPPGQLVEPAGPRSQAQVARTAGTPQASEPSRSLQGQFVDPEGLGTRARVSLDSWLKPRALGKGPDSHGTAGRPLRASDPGPRPRDSLSTSQALGTGPEPPGTAGRPRRHLEPGRSRPGHLVDTAGLRAWARVTWETWSTPRALGHGPGSPGTAGRPEDLGPGPESPGRFCRPCGPSGPGPSRPGPEIDPAIPRTGRERPGTAG